MRQEIRNKEKIIILVKNIYHNPQLMSFIAFVVTLLALTLSFVQIHLSNNQSESTEELQNLTTELSDAIDYVKNSVPTHYIGEFPSFIKEINEVLTKAQKKIIIFEDVLTYGAYSNPAEFHKLITVLLEKAGKNVQITIVVYDSTLYRKTRAVQFIGLENMPKYKELKQKNEKRANNVIDSIYRKKLDTKILENFLQYDFVGDKEKTNFRELDKIKNNLKGISIESLKYNDHFQTLVSMGEYIQRRFDDANITIISTKTPHVMNCWLVDDNKVVFGFPSNSDAKEISFYTEDKHIIEYVKKMLELYENKSTNISLDD